MFRVLLSTIPTKSNDFVPTLGIAFLNFGHFSPIEYLSFYSAPFIHTKKIFSDQSAY
jgi:hypothetical protein